MADNLEDKKFDAIDENSVIELQINGKFYGDMRGVFFHYLTEGRTKEEIGDILENLGKGQITQEEEYPLYVMFQFLVYMQGQAEAQGFIVKKDIPTSEFPENPHSETGPSE